MNILHLSAQKPDSTGSGIYLAQLVEGFARAGHTQAVIAGIGPEDAPAFPAGVSFHPVRFETDELPFPVAGMSNVMPYKATRYCDFTPEMAVQFKAAFAHKLAEVLDSFTPDLVICHHLYLATSVVVHGLQQHALENPALANCKAVAVCHSTDINQMRMHSLERDFIIEGIQMLDEVLALHAPQAAEIAEVYGVPAERIRVIGTGYDKGQFFPEPGMREEGARRLVYVGKIWRRKGVESLISAISQMTPEDAPTETILVGGYSDQAEYDEAFALAQVCPYPIRFAGVVSQQELIDSYNRANVFVLPSFYEGLPLVILEAMGCGCNVVATDLPGIQEWICAHLPDAPIWFVEPPTMRTSDEPAEEALPAFEAHLAQALAEALAAPAPTADPTVLSWDAVCNRIVQSR